MTGIYFNFHRYLELMKRICISKQKLLEIAHIHENKLIHRLWKDMNEIKVWIMISELISLICDCALDYSKAKHLHQDLQRAGYNETEMYFHRKHSWLARMSRKVVSKVRWALKRSQSYAHNWEHGILKIAFGQLQIHWRWLINSNIPRARINYGYRQDKMHRR